MLQERFDQIFGLVQSRPDFSPEGFVKALKELREAVPR